MKDDKLVVCSTGELCATPRDCLARGRCARNKTAFLCANKVQVGGDHYRKYGDLQPWDVWGPWNLNPFQANIIKYTVRYRDKDGLKDLEKAKHYLDKLIEVEKAKCT